MYQKILVGVDGSESNKNAVKTALKMAKESGGKVTAMCVFDIGSYSNSIWGIGEDKDRMIEMAEQALTFAVTSAAEMGIELDTKISIGRPAEAICQEAANYEIVIVGTHGRTGISHAIIGSVAERIVRGAPCPVLVCRD